MSRLLVVMALLLAITVPAHAEVVRIPHQGITLNANLEKAQDAWSDGPVLLMTHGTLAHRGMEIISGLQELMAERGVSSLAINLSLGLDDRPAAMYECAIPHTHKHTDAVGEIGAWLTWLKKQGATNISLFGHSRGGNQTARFAASAGATGVNKVFLAAPQTQAPGYAAKDYQKRYKTALGPLLKAATAKVADGQGKVFMDKVDFIYCEDTRATAEAFVSYHGEDKDMDTPTVIPRIPMPVTVFVGSADKVVSGLTEAMEDIADGERVQLVVMDDADHFFRDLYAEDMADLIAEGLVPQ